MDYLQKIPLRIFCSRFFFSSMLLLFISLSQVIAQESPHKQENLNCETCHVSTSWKQIRFNHDLTKFPLLDRHQEVDCRSCHDIEDFRTTSSDCFACHEDIHQAKMGGDCEQCHSSKGWEIFNVEEIHANTQFPMMGRHTLVDCQSCHQSQQQGDFALLTTDCVSCHQQSYLATENPNHVANSFSTNCQECHGMDDWQPAFLPNHDVFFPVFSGTHDGAWSDCVVCHQNPATFSDFTCLSCHEHEQPKMDEEHQGIAGYAYESNACFTCHPTGEKGEFKEHDTRFFPIFTGKHAGEWEDCAVCHNNTANRQEFTCLVCHEHGQSEMDTKHQGIQGYAYQSNDCFACHPTGEKGEFRDHDAQFFPIFTGNHAGAWAECMTCHPNPTNRQEFTCVVCHEHRQEEMDPKHAGIPDYSFDSSQCLFCHPAGEKGEFTQHDNLFFPIFTGKHTGAWAECSTCHLNPTNRQEFTCLVCHEHRQSEMDAKHQGIQGYAYQSNDCFTCHPTGEGGDFREHDNLFFPIFIGAHAGSWDECLTCHPNPTNRQEFTCIVCHEHRQSEMDLKHQGFPNYSFDSSQCLFCHPDGVDPLPAGHDPLFPISRGPHRRDCIDCHIEAGNFQRFECIQCHEHRQQKMDDKHLGKVQGYVWESNACLDCHPNGKKS